jgi:formylglycine-generating enzyme required for sulfatase activity
LALFVLISAGCTKPADRVTRAEDALAPVSEAPDPVPDPASVQSARRSEAGAPDLAPPKKHSDACPAGMLEIDGLYCTALMHRCIRGGRTKEGERSDRPDPYYCDEYKLGHAKCLGKQQRKHFCIDDYEHPNREGAIPMVMVSWYEAKRLCEEQGKRLCGDDEWTLACEGPDRRPFTYGWERDSGACNIDKLWRKPDDGLLAQRDAAPERIAAEIDRLSQRVPSGSMPRCVSPYGAHDMGGNVDEWCVNVTLDGKPYQSIFKGGHWVGGARNRCRPYTESHDETTAYYAEGFRCCADSAPRDR